MFRTKVVEKIKTHILHSETFCQKSCCLWDNVEKYGAARDTIHKNRVCCMHIACWITKVTDAHSEYEILTAFPHQQWSSGGASMLCLYIDLQCLSCLNTTTMSWSS